MSVTQLPCIYGEFLCHLNYQPKERTQHQILISENFATRQTNQIIGQRSHTHANAHANASKEHIQIHQSCLEEANLDAEFLWEILLAAFKNNQTIHNICISCICTHFRRASNILQRTKCTKWINKLKSPEISNPLGLRWSTYYFKMELH